MVVKIILAYRACDKEYEALDRFEPAEQTDPSAPDVYYDPQIAAMEEEYPDARGWLVMDGTNISYPFAIASDNDKYLRRALDGSYITAGTLFIDCRCGGDFKSFNTIIYGHKMNNGTMFAALEDYADESFFDADRSGTIFLVDGRLRLTPAACLVVSEYDTTVYDPAADPTAFREYIKANAKCLDEEALNGSDSFVTLSTCSYSFRGARTVLVCAVAR